MKDVQGGDFVELYMLDVTPLEDLSVFRRYYEACINLYRNKIDAKKKKEDKCRTLGGAILIAEGLSRRGIDINSAELCFSEYGKPYLIGNKVHFNISHSGKYVVAAFSDYEVGIDIEMHRDVKMKLADRYFTPSEARYLQLLHEGKEREKAFFKLWTKKESLIKAFGEGFGIPLDSFEALDTKNVILRGNRYHMLEYAIDGYSVSVCCRENETAPGIENISI